MNIDKIKQCSKCKCFDRLYTMWNDRTGTTLLKGCFCTTEFGICERKDKVVRSTYICTNYKEKECKRWKF